MKKIIANVKKGDSKNFFLWDVELSEFEDFEVNNPFNDFPYELKSENEIRDFIKGRLNFIGYKLLDNNIEIKYV